MFVLISGLALAFNCIILIHKFRKQRYTDATLDLIILMIISIATAGTMTGLSIGMIGSMLVSFYLLWRPVRILKW
jgi:hypothetical protein